MIDYQAALFGFRASRHNIEQSCTFCQVDFTVYFSLRDLKMGKLSKILFRSLFISSTLAQSDTQDDSSDSQTFQVTECNDETDDVS